MQQDYYKEYYNYEREHWWFVAREKIIISTIKNHILKKIVSTEPLKILNIGCSTGRSSEYLSQFGTVTSLEYDAACCEFTTKKTGLEIINGSITELPFSVNSFDLVCAFDVIEHVEDHELAVEEMKRVAKQNGILFVTVPAFMSLWSHHDEVNFHFRRYKKNDLIALFDKTKNGETIFVSYFNSILFLPIWMYRKTSNILKFGNKREGAGSDFESFNNGISNKILFNIMHFEKHFIKRGMIFPTGVSLINVWQLKK